MRKRGITLIELIIVLGLNTIILATIYTISLVSNKVMLRTEMQAELQNSAEEIQSKLIYNLEAASKIVMINDTSTEEIYYNDLFDYSSDEIKEIDINSMEIKYGDEKVIKLSLIDSELSYIILNENNEVIEEERTIAKYIETFSIVPSDIRQVKDITTYNLKNAQGIRISILLKASKGYVKMEYPISTIITFRN